MIALLALLVMSLPAGAETGLASYYKHGKWTASGARFKPYGLTAAHRTHKFGTVLLVTNIRNGKSVRVIINDRGPFVRRRIIDLSLGAAQAIGMVGSGTAVVRLSR